jgi:hypothetical protein
VNHKNLEEGGQNEFTTGENNRIKKNPGDMAQSGFIGFCCRCPGSASISI